MNVSIDLTILPIGTEVSISKYIAKCKKEIEKRGLDYRLGPDGTAIEGEWDDVFECVKACHHLLHKSGVIRIFSSVKINTRVDKKVSFKSKVDNVNCLLSKGESPE